VLGRIRLRVAGSGPVMPFWLSLLMDGMLWAGQVPYFDHS
jgi:3-oxoadipate enol-lactonase